MAEVLPLVRGPRVHPAPWGRPPRRVRRPRFVRRARLAAILAAGFAAGFGLFAVVDTARAPAPVRVTARPADDARAPAPRAAMPLCAGPQRHTCVVDGDTFWYRGEKIRVADIDAPELSPPRCPREAELGEAAKRRLAELLGAGPFTLSADGPDEDRYGRKLRTVRRDGRSLGDVMVVEGLARPWSGARRGWCG